MVTFGLFDKSFAHDVSAVAGVIPEFVTWDRESPLAHKTLFITDDEILRLSDVDFGARTRVAWLIESQSIKPYLYSNVRLLSKFDLVLTHSSYLLRTLENAHFVPGGGIWIGGRHAGGTIGLKDKSDLCSMVSSYKISAPLHRKRLLYASLLRSLPRTGVKVYLGSKTVSSTEATARFAFNIAVENFLDRTYFTERLLNCFATGTIPIYYGAPELPAEFSEEGILRFTNFGELKELLGTLSLEKYQEMHSHVIRNYLAAQKYRSLEDYIWSHYSELLEREK